MITAKNKSGHARSKNTRNEAAGHGNMPKEDPRKRTSKEEILYPHQSEAGPQREGADASFTERNDVTPPNKKEFPSVGPAKTDFEARKLGRTTGRMIGHEPGTESI
ncbi:hypothetical protein [Mucilaginibacter sp. BT774]|uniref:hypothetical protein n=1 Tax=Mucilaginibacter sp. BT774 TaxID=3062276 RepID=UPI002674CF38|nr:hypothetical protein [Mucilaginibacter sp. BT774]MDO3626140.1 hypothetical protein [Mucilaginibacter sp. BT774]